jgi:hypothetical protein
LMGVIWRMVARHAGTLLISLLHSTFFDLLKGYPDCDLVFSVDSKWVSAAHSIGRNSRISLS